MSPKSEVSHSSNTEVEVDKVKDKIELLSNGQYYDITHWMKRHPGGNIIKLYANSGEDATIAVEQFHFRSSEKVMAIMKSLPHRSAIENDNYGMSEDEKKRHQALTTDFSHLFKELKEEGLFEPSWKHLFLRVTDVLFLLTLGAYFVECSYRNGDGNTNYYFKWLQWVVGIFISGLATGRGGWIGHEGGHFSSTGNVRIDKMIEQTFMGLFCGIAASYWTNQHSRHHAGPQHLQYDVDLHTMPLVAFNKQSFKVKNGHVNFLVKYQKWLFFPVTTAIMVILWQFLLHPIYAIRKRKWGDLITLVLHHALYIYSLGFGNAYIINYLGGLYLFGNFTLSHTHLPIAKDQTHWVEYSLSHTMNVRSSWWVDYWMGYLNYQIEHHLFPTMPQFRNKLCRDRVKKLAKKHGLPYQLCSYREALEKVLNNLGSVAHELMHEHVR